MPTTTSEASAIVSIITPTFNHERYILRCLRSAIEQTDPRWELVVVDDGSSDRTGDIVRAIDDPRIRYVRREHRGIMHLADAYNTGLELSHGRYVAILEGDDFWPSTKLERQVPVLDGSGAVMGWGMTGITDEDGVLLWTSPGAGEIARLDRNTRGQNLRLLLERNFVPAVTAMIRRDALDRIGGFQQPPGVATTDYPTWLELCRLGRFAATKDLLGYHRVHPRQASIQERPAMDLVLYSGARFIENLTASERRELGVTIEEAHAIERRRAAYLHFAAGREALRTRSPIANAYFRAALRRGSSTTRLKACVGLAHSILGFDLERTAAFGERLVRG